MRLGILILALTALIGCSSSVRTGRDNTGTRSSSSAALTSARKAVLNESGKWLGTPYRYGGSSRSGTDCSGFVSTIYAGVGVSLPRRAREMYEVGTPVSLKTIIPGDLVFFANTAGKGITHVGIYTGQSKFIHASTSSGVVYSSLEQDYYSRHYVGARKVLR